MAKEVNKVMKDSVMIVGADHLYGLLHETDLRSHYHTVAINTISQDRFKEVLKDDLPDMGMEYSIKCSLFHNENPHLKNVGIF